MTYFPKNRIEAFSDGVFAIVVTLLVLELKVPELTDPSQLPAALVHLMPKFLSWVISFAVVCIFWVNHHRLFHTLKQADNNVPWLNGLYLMFISFIPFPTALMGEYIQDKLPVIFFGAVMVLASLTASLLRAYASRKDELLEDGLNHSEVRSFAKRSFLFGPVLYACAALSGWIHPYVAVGLYVVIPIYFILPKRVHK
jgi:uncharacterized membrane protein